MGMFNRRASAPKPTPETTPLSSAKLQSVTSSSLASEVNTNSSRRYYQVSQSVHGYYSYYDK